MRSLFTWVVLCVLCSTPSHATTAGVMVRGNVPKEIVQWYKSYCSYFEDESNKPAMLYIVNDRVDATTQVEMSELGEKVLEISKYLCDRINESPDADVEVTTMIGCDDDGLQCIFDSLSAFLDEIEKLVEDKEFMSILFGEEGEEQTEDMPELEQVLQSSSSAFVGPTVIGFGNPSKIAHAKHALDATQAGGSQKVTVVDANYEKSGSGSLWDWWNRLQNQGYDNYVDPTKKEHWWKDADNNWVETDPNHKQGFLEYLASMTGKLFGGGNMNEDTKTT